MVSCRGAFSPLSAAATLSPRSRAAPDQSSSSSSLELLLEFELELLLELEFELSLEFELELLLELELELLLEFELELSLELELELSLELELELLLELELELSREFEFPGEPPPRLSSPSSMRLLRKRTPSDEVGGADLPTPGPMRLPRNPRGPPFSWAAEGAAAPVRDTSAAVKNFLAVIDMVPLGNHVSSKPGRPLAYSSIMRFVSTLIKYRICGGFLPGQGHFTTGGRLIRTASGLWPVWRPNWVPRS